MFNKMLKYSSVLYLFFTVFISSCNKYELIDIPNNIKFSQNLSDYKIFQGNLSHLNPSEGLELYELSTPLFTDYSEKQRLIKIPKGLKIKALGDGIPDFPDGTTFVKTFFYYNDKNDLSKGKKIIETRLLIKDKIKWNVATYVWNQNQTDATLQTEGSDQKISWIDNTGKTRNINYHIPANKECSTCHQSQNSIIPLGPKLRNLNFDVIRNDIKINQLKYFQDLNMFEAIDISTINTLPDWQDAKFKTEQRARAYLDINCSHCHSSKGFAARTGFNLEYETPYLKTGLANHKKAIIKLMETPIPEARMPRLGTTIIHQEGLDLIKAYINSLGK